MKNIENFKPIATPHFIISTEIILIYWELSIIFQIDILAPTNNVDSIIELIIYVDLCLEWTLDLPRIFATDRPSTL